MTTITGIRDIGLAKQIIEDFGFYWPNERLSEYLDSVLSDNSKKEINNLFAEKMVDYIRKMSN